MPPSGPPSGPATSESPPLPEAWPVPLGGGRGSRLPGLPDGPGAGSGQVTEGHQHGASQRTGPPSPSPSGASSWLWIFPLTFPTALTPSRVSSPGQIRGAESQPLSTALQVPHALNLRPCQTYRDNPFMSLESRPSFNTRGLSTNPGRGSRRRPDRGSRPGPRPALGHKARGRRTATYVGHRAPHAWSLRPADPGLPFTCGPCSTEVRARGTGGTRTSPVTVPSGHASLFPLQGNLSCATTVSRVGFQTSAPRTADVWPTLCPTASEPGHRVTHPHGRGRCGHHTRALAPSLPAPSPCGLHSAQVGQPSRCSDIQPSDILTPLAAGAAPALFPKQRESPAPHTHPCVSCVLHRGTDTEPVLGKHS